ncbi:MAG: sugar phosphate isomerase/epimerase family protein [Planctomycetia bacterium]|nr:sugar phosphate isomerase/epimerase family protein [Planctomycetia bacterium]
MIYAINTLLWSDTVDENLIPVLEEIHALGYTGVEFPLFAPDIRKCERLGKVAKELGLSVTTCTCRGELENPASPDEAIRRHGIAVNKQMIDCSVALGSRILIGPYHTAIGYFTGKSVSSDEWQRTAESMRETAEYAAQNGIYMALECVNRFETYFINCIADGLKFIRTVDHPHYKLMFDTFHANIEEKSLAEAIRLAATDGNLIHVHISENDRSTPGAGNIRWKEVFATLQEVGYSGTLCIEAFGASLPKIAAATKIWRKMYDTETQLITDGLRFMQSWENF